MNFARGKIQCNLQMMIPKMWTCIRVALSLSSLSLSKCLFVCQHPLTPEENAIATIIIGAHKLTEWLN